MLTTIINARLNLRNKDLRRQIGASVEASSDWLMSVSGGSALHLKIVPLVGGRTPLLKDGASNVTKTGTWRITKVLYQESTNNIGKH